MTNLSLFLCGDVMLGRGVDQIMRHPGNARLYESHVASARDYVRLAERVHGPIPRKVDATYVWGDALAVLAAERPTARIINLETAVTTHGRPWPKGIHYRMHPANIDCLTAARIDCCVLANNHVLDWGREGLVETLAILRNAGIATAGAGQDAFEAAAPAIVPADHNTRILVFGFAATTSGVPEKWTAGPSTPGVNLLPDLSPATAVRLAAAACEWRRAGDLLVASIHWGGNWGYAVEERDFAQALVACGFDLVHGHSSHHPKGVEVFRDRFIIYGCGDFLNDYEGIAGYEEFRGDLTVMYLPCFDTVTGHLVSARMVPMWIHRFQLRRASREQAQWLYRVLARESAKLGTTITWLEPGTFMIEIKGGSVQPQTR